MIQQKLIEKFGGVINHMSCIYLRQGEKHLRSFLEELKPMDTIIEIGTYQGVSACVLAEYAKKVYTFDIKEKELTGNIINFLNITNIASIIMSESSIKKYIKDLFKHQKIDLCFIDGEHFNGEIEQDFEMCKECKNILIHDYAPSFKEVYDFANNLKGYKKDVRDTFVLLTKVETGKEIKEKISQQIENIEKPKKKRKWLRRKRIKE